MLDGPERLVQGLNGAAEEEVPVLVHVEDQPVFQSFDLRTIVMIPPNGSKTLSSHTRAIPAMLGQQHGSRSGLQVRLGAAVGTTS